MLKSKLILFRFIVTVGTYYAPPHNLNDNG